MVVSDTSPLNYLILIDAVGVLPRLHSEVWIPTAVRAELSHLKTPERVRDFMAEPPSWLVTVEPLGPPDAGLLRLGRGEQAAILLAGESPASAVVIDERAGATEALHRGLRVVGTLGILDAAASCGLVKMRDALANLEQTTFRMPQAVKKILLARHG